VALDEVSDGQNAVVLDLTRADLMIPEEHYERRHAENALARSIPIDAKRAVGFRRFLNYELLTHPSWQGQIELLRGWQARADAAKSKEERTYGPTIAGSFGHGSVTLDALSFERVERRKSASEKKTERRGILGDVLGASSLKDTIADYPIDGNGVYKVTAWPGNRKTEYGIFPHIQKYTLTDQDGTEKYVTDTNMVITLFEGSNITLLQMFDENEHITNGKRLGELSDYVSGRLLVRSSNQIPVLGGKKVYSAGKESADMAAWGALNEPLRRLVRLLAIHLETEAKPTAAEVAYNKQSSPAQLSGPFGLVTNYFYQHSFLSHAVEFCIVNLFPRS
jgi:hypothetical protein